MITQNLTVDDNWMEVDDNCMEVLESTKPEKPISFLDDPIALGCASYRMTRAGHGMYHDFEFLKVEPEDRRQAQNIRNYYRAKITWELIKGNQQQRPLTPFRQKLMGIIENTYQITHNDLGILYRVPYFYQEDIAHDAIFQDLPEYELLNKRGENVESTFTLIQQVSVMRRARDTIQYWLKTPGSIVPCMTMIDSKNILKPLLDSVLTRGPVNLRANWYPKLLWGGQDRDRLYYQLASIELA